MQDGKSRRELEEAARRTHFGRVRHVCQVCNDDLAERDKRLARCQELYAQDLRRVELDYQAQQRAARGAR